MDDTAGLPDQWLAPLHRARAALTVADEVGLALRAHRRELAMSQRAYAAMRGFSRAMLARLEAGAGRLSLDTVVEALDGTGFTLHVTYDGDEPGPQPDGSATALAVPAREREVEGRHAPVPPQAWTPTDLVARVRGGGRRFPAHRRVRHVTKPPMWWWMHEFFRGPSEEPQWYSPVFQLERVRPHRSQDDPARGAA